MELSEESAVNQEKKERESERMVEKKNSCLLTTSPFFLGFSLSFSALFSLCVHCKASFVNENVCVCACALKGGGWTVLMGRLGVGLNKR